MDYKPYGTANTVLIGLQLDISNGFIIQHGCNNSWTQIYYPISFTTYCSVVAVELGASHQYEFSCIYNVDISYFYINCKFSNASNFTTLFHWIAVGV